MAVPKYMSRFDLYFSGTYATVRVPPDAELEIADVASPGGNLMSDGCGLIHEELVVGVMDKLGLTEVRAGI